MLVLCTIIAFLGNRLTSILSAAIDLFGTMLLLAAAMIIYFLNINADCSVPNCQTRTANGAFGLVIINMSEPRSHRNVYVY
jgi:hypothetical protein